MNFNRCRCRKEAPQPKYWTQMINEFILRRIVQYNLNLIPDKNNFLPNFIYLIVEFWITETPYS
jgi:hypothetical protein